MRTSKLLRVIVIAFLLLYNLNVLKAQVTWNEVYVGDLEDWSPLVQVDEDGYVHFGNQDVLSNTYAQDPNENVSGILAHFAKNVPSGDDIYFPALAVKNKFPHLCYRHTKNGAIFTVGYWNPSMSSVDFFMEPGYHGHYPNIQVSSDNTVHIFYQMDDSNYGNIYYQNSEDLTIQTMMPYGFDASSTLYSYATAIDNNDELHWIGSIYKYEAGHGKNLYYNHSTNGIFDSIPELMNGYDGYFPSLAVDADGVVHAVWELDDILYSTRDESGWSNAVIISEQGIYSEYYLLYTQLAAQDCKAIVPSPDLINRAWNVGVGGIYRTDDNWDHYQTQYVNNSTTINNIHPVDSLNAFCVGDKGKFWYTSNGGRHVPLVGDGWFEDSTGVTVNLNDCWFFDTNSGFAIGDSGTILKTINGGTDWNEVQTNVLTNLYAIEFPTPDTGYIAADSGKVLITINCGVTWSVSDIGNDNCLLDLCTLGKDTIWVAGKNSEVHVSYNGGSTWTQKNSGVSSYVSDLYGIYFVNESLGYLVGTKNGSYYYICKTEDGGNSWTGEHSINGNGVTSPMTDVYAFNEDSIFISGSQGGIYFGTMKTNAQYHKPGIAIDQNGYAHVAYWGTGDHVYYANNTGGSWSSQQTIKAWSYMEQIDGSSRIGLDFKTNTIYVGVRTAGGQSYLVFTDGINLCAPTVTDATSTLTASAALTEPTEITETVNDSINALEVFDFTVNDIANDGLPTKVTQLNIRKGPLSSPSLNFSETLGGATLTWQSNTISYDSINEGIISFGNGSSILTSIPEGSSVTFTLKIWLDTNGVIIDGNTFDFKISGAHDVYVDTTGSLMAIEPSDITSGTIKITLTPAQFIFTGVPDGILYGSDYCFVKEFKVSVANSTGNICKNVTCNDLVLSAVKTDSVSSIAGTVTISPSGPQTCINGSAGYSGLLFSEGHQKVRLKATGTVDGIPFTSYSEAIPVYPYSNQIVLRNDNDSLFSDPFIGEALNNLGHTCDVLNVCNRYTKLPACSLNDYDIVWVDENNTLAADSAELINYINQASSSDKKALAVFGCLTYGMSGISPRSGGLMSYFGIGKRKMYPEYAMVTGNEIIQGIDGNPISDGISVRCNEPELFSFIIQTYPLTDSANVQVVFGTPLEGENSYPVPTAISHTGTNYKTFRSGFFLDEYGSSEDIDTIVSRLLNWFNSPYTDDLGHAPYFLNSLTSSIYETEFLSEDVPFSYTALCEDIDPGDVLTVKAVVKPCWLNAASFNDSLQLTGTPHAENAGDTALILKVTDENNNFSLQYSGINIQHVNHDPVIEGPVTDNAYVGYPYYCILTKTDPDTVMGDEMSWFIASQSHFWIDLDDYGNLYGTPSPGDTGVTDVSIIVTDLYGGMAVHNISINVSEASGPVIDITPDNLFFTVQEDSTASDNINIVNTGEDDLNWNAEESTSWLEIENSSGSLASQNSELMIISVNSAGLNPDNYYADITINSNSLINSVLVIPVELEVTEAETDTISYIRSKSMNKIRVFPSPVTDELYIDLRDSEKGNYEITLTNLEGKVILVNSYSHIIKNDKLILNLTQLETGIYCIKIRSDNYLTTRKIVKIN
jgi:photosystem II stability/assembly factor-like uncharacterized protein